jgi:hypothetical protein
MAIAGCDRRGHHSAHPVHHQSARWWPCAPSQPQHIEAADRVDTHQLLVEDKGTGSTIALDSSDGAPGAVNNCANETVGGRTIEASTITTRRMVHLVNVIGV